MSATRSQDLGGRLFFLEIGGGRVLSVDSDGSNRKVIATGGRTPDRIVVDAEAGHIYWTSMGSSARSEGSIERVDLDGRNQKTIVAAGATLGPKQLHLDKAGGKLYWAEREGMRIVRMNLGGSKVETLVDRSEGAPRSGNDAESGCVGVAVDPFRGQIYWTEPGPAKGREGRIFRAGIDVPSGQTAANRRDIVAIVEALPEPTDLQMDIARRMIYWTERGDTLMGSRVSRLPMDADFTRLPVPEVVLQHAMDGVGVAMDWKGRRMFFADLSGSIYVARLDRSQPTVLAIAQGNLTGIAYAELPRRLG